MKSAIGDGRPKYSFLGKANNLKINDTHTPGSYNPRFEYVSEKGNEKLGSVFGKNNRFSSPRKDDAPAPSKYDLNLPKSKASTIFTKSKRSKDDKAKTEVPGPGNYDLKSEFEKGLQSNKGVSMKTRGQSAKSSTEVPGPGAYYSKYDGIKKRGNSAKIGKAARFKGENYDGCRAAPGQYDPKLIDERSNIAKAKIKGSKSFHPTYQDRISTTHSCLESQLVTLSGQKLRIRNPLRCQAPISTTPT